MSDDVKLYDTLVPQYSYDTVQYPVKICRECIAHAYFSRHAIDNMYEGSLCIDNCHDCRNYYFVEPSEFDRRIGQEGRGTHRCDSCLLNDGYGSSRYLQTEDCDECGQSTDFFISLIKQLHPKQCTCTKHREQSEELEDLARDYDEHQSVREGFLFKKNKESNIAFFKINVDTMGYFHQEPNNIYGAAYEINNPDKLDSSRCVTFDLIEFDQSFLVSIDFDIQKLDIHKSIATILTYCPHQNIEGTHDEYFSWSVEGFNRMEKCAHQLSQNYINSIRNEIM